MCFILKPLLHLTIQSDPNIDGNLSKHYITIFMRGAISVESEELVNLEPHKCECWNWVPWEEIVLRRKEHPDTLFEPMRHLVDGLVAGDRTPFV
jgi:hypothetical protein